MLLPAAVQPHDGKLQELYILTFARNILRKFLTQQGFHLRCGGNLNIATARFNSFSLCKRETDAYNLKISLCGRFNLHGFHRENGITHQI
jgi:hypothetical protein